jgi:hypothetical protein
MRREALFRLHTEDGVLWVTIPSKIAFFERRRAIVRSRRNHLPDAERAIKSQSTYCG